LQNYHIDIKTLVKYIDGHMFIDAQKKTGEVGLGFFFNYQIDEEN